MMVLVAWRVRCFRIRLIRRICKIADLHMVLNVGLEGEGIVKDNAQVSSRGSGVNFNMISKVTGAK